MLPPLSFLGPIALKTARLYEEARKTERRLHEDLATAREIQRQLLPSGAREVPGLDLAAGYCSARELAGDFYVFLPTATGPLPVALAVPPAKARARPAFAPLPPPSLPNHTPHT